MDRMCLAKKFGGAVGLTRLKPLACSALALTECICGGLSTLVCLVFRGTGADGRDPGLVLNRGQDALLLSLTKSPPRAAGVRLMLCRSRAFMGCFLVVCERCAATAEAFGIDRPGHTLRGFSDTYRDRLVHKDLVSSFESLGIASGLTVGSWHG
jgi:hypothetical protein